VVLMEGEMAAGMFLTGRLQGESELVGFGSALGIYQCIEGVVQTIGIQ